jgi:hypothetical protein
MMSLDSNDSGELLQGLLYDGLIRLSNLHQFVLLHLLVLARTHAVAIVEDVRWVRLTMPDPCSKPLHHHRFNLVDHLLNINKAPI